MLLILHKFHSTWFESEFSTIALLTFLCQIILCCEDYSAQFRMFNSIPGIYQLDVSSNPTSCVIVRCPLEGKSPWWRATDLNDAAMSWGRAGKTASMGFIKKPKKSHPVFQFLYNKALLNFFFFPYSCFLTSPDALMSSQEGNSKIFFETAPNK